MKILISESQMDKLVNDYINNELSNLIQRETIVTDDERFEKYWFKASTGKLILIVDMIGDSLFIVTSLVSDICDIFYLRRGKVVRYVKMWVEKNLDIHPIKNAYAMGMNGTLSDFDSGNL